MKAARPMAEQEITFACDSMLGRLARWLRILGYPAEYHRRAQDARLVREARARGHVLVTRDTRLVRRRDVGPHVLLSANDSFGQLRELARVLGLTFDPHRAGRLCVVCNRPLVPVERDFVRGLVPPYVFATQTSFTRCPSCGRFFWRATHHRAMMARLAALFDEAGREDR